MRPGIGARRAAVLALIGETEGRLDLLFTERAHSLRTHAGQIAFPGGAADAADTSLAETALREAEEEAGVVPASVDVLGCLPPAHVAVSGFDVTTVLGWWAEPGPVHARDTAEVASVHRIPVDVLTDPANRASARHPSGYIGPAFVVGDLFIWGLTAHLTDAVLELAGWSRPWDQRRRLDVPVRFLTDRLSGVDPTGANAH